MFPDTLHIGPIPIHLFGIGLAAAFLAAGQVLAKELSRKGYDPDLASTVLLWAAGGGLVCARLWLVVEQFSEFAADPLGFLFTGSGFVFYGGLIGGTIAVTMVFRRHGIPWARGADAAAPALAMGQAVGRIGCQISGDGDWGIVTTVPWGMAYPHAVAGWPYPPGVVVHPTPIYESLAYFTIFAVLWRWRTRPAPAGALFCWYLALSGTARFLVEFLRINPRIGLGLSSAQWMSILLVTVGSSWLLSQRAWRSRAAS